MARSSETIDYLIELLVLPGATRETAIQQLRSMSGTEIVDAILNHQRNRVNVRGKKLKD